MRRSSSRSSVDDAVRRTTVAQRRMAGGSLDGRAEAAAPLPDRPKGAPYRPGDYTALLPWGYAGDASTKNGWHSIHLTEADATAEDAPYLHFGLAPAENNAVGIGGTMDAGTWELYVDDDWWRLEGLSQGTTDMLGVYLTANGAADAVGMTLQGPEYQTLDITADLDHVALDMFTLGAQAYLDVQDDGDVYLRLDCSGTGSAAAWVQLNESAADPPAPSGNRVRVFAKDNGAGKTQLCARFATGAVQVVATQP